MNLRESSNAADVLVDVALAEPSAQEKENQYQKQLQGMFAHWGKALVEKFNMKQVFKTSRKK